MRCELGRVLRRDDDCHWYLIPPGIDHEFDAWVEHSSARWAPDAPETWPVWEGTTFDDFRIDNVHTLTIYEYTEG